MSHSIIVMSTHSTRSKQTTTELHTKDTFLKIVAVLTKHRYVINPVLGSERINKYTDTDYILHDLQEVVPSMRN
jgi:hypothetical protein